MVRILRVLFTRTSDVDGEVSMGRKGLLAEVCRRRNLGMLECWRNKWEEERGVSERMSGRLRALTGGRRVFLRHSSYSEGT